MSLFPLLLFGMDEGIIVRVDGKGCDRYNTPCRRVLFGSVQEKFFTTVEKKMQDIADETACLVTVYLSGENTIRVVFESALEKPSIKDLKKKLKKRGMEKVCTREECVSCNNEQS